MHCVNKRTHYFIKETSKPFIIIANNIFHSQIIPYVKHSHLSVISSLHVGHQCAREIHHLTITHH